jgi:type VI secretion system peptidoglycan-associated protein
VEVGRELPGKSFGKSEGGKKRRKMSDVFLSYAREDREQAEVLARALERQGLSVWWDRAIPPGFRFDFFISEALDAARCVVVMWSQRSISSDWVREEAAEGLRRGILIPAVTEHVRLPLGFRQLHCADLSKWDGNAEHSEFVVLLAALRKILATSTGDVENPGIPVPESQGLDRDQLRTLVVEQSKIIIGGESPAGPLQKSPDLRELVAPTDDVFRIHSSDAVVPLEMVLRSPQSQPVEGRSEQSLRRIINDIARLTWQQGWAIAVTMLLLFGIYLSFRLSLVGASDALSVKIAALRVGTPIARKAAPEPRLAKLFAKEIAEGLITVDDQADRSIVTIDSDGMFKPGEATTIRAQYGSVLGRVADELAKNPGQVDVIGHTDSVPIRTLRFSSNWELSKARAESVAKILATRMDPGRLTIDGVAGTQPITSNDTPKGRARNRRVEIILHLPADARSNASTGPPPVKR